MSRVVVSTSNTTMRTPDVAGIRPTREPQPAVWLPDIHAHVTLLNETSRKKAVDSCSTGVIVYEGVRCGLSLLH